MKRDRQFRENFVLEKPAHAVQISRRSRPASIPHSQPQTLPQSSARQEAQNQSHSMDMSYYDVPGENPPKYPKIASSKKLKGNHEKMKNGQKNKQRDQQIGSSLSLSPLGRQSLTTTTRLTAKPFQPVRRDTEAEWQAISIENPNNPRELLHLVKVVDTRLATLHIYASQNPLKDQAIMSAMIEPDHATWRIAFDENSPLIGYFGICTVLDLNEGKDQSEQTFIILLTWPKHTRATFMERLRALARAGGRHLAYWAVLVFALMAVDFGFQDKSPQHGLYCLMTAPAVFSDMMSDRYSGGSQELGAKEILELGDFDRPGVDGEKVEKILDNLDPAGLAFFWLEFGKNLWRDNQRQHLLQASDLLDKKPFTFQYFGLLADVCLRLLNKNKAEIRVAGANLLIPLGNYVSNISIWHQIMEFERWNAPLDVIRKILSIQLAGGSFVELTLQEGFDHRYAAALTNQLIADAKKNQIFAPQGAFSMTLPPNLPLQGVDGLYIQVTPQGMWVLLQGAGQAMFWQPEAGNMASGWETDPPLAAALYLILAAIWHDLVTRGSEVMVRLGNEREPENKVRLARRTRSRPKKTAPMQLPSDKIIYLDGVHSWGTDEELEKIQRQAHQVRGHARRLFPGWQRSWAAAQNAQRFSFVVPDGYTFVQPYQTGLKDLSSPKDIETPIVARGLASVILMGKISRRQA